MQVLTEIILLLHRSAGVFVSLHFLTPSPLLSQLRLFHLTPFQNLESYGPVSVGRFEKCIRCSSYSTTTTEAGESRMNKREEKSGFLKGVNIIVQSAAWIPLWRQQSKHTNNYFYVLFNFFLFLSLRIKLCSVLRGAFGSFWATVWFLHFFFHSLAESYSGWTWAFPCVPR